MQQQALGAGQRRPSSPSPGPYASLWASMVEPGFLLSPRVRRWLNGVEPVWTLLASTSFNGLRQHSADLDGPLQIRSDLTEADCANFPAAENTVLLLRHALDNDGLRLTATPSAGPVIQCAAT